MARKITERKEVDSAIRLDEFLGCMPIGVRHKDIYVASEPFWEYGESYNRLVISWEREETDNERLIRERTDRLRREAAAEEQERKDQEEYSRLSRKYGTSA